MFETISPSDPAATPASKTRLPHFQRGWGRADLVFTRAGRRSIARRTYQSGTLKLRFPNVARDTPPEVVLINLGGGLTGGDRVEVSARLDHAASATLTTQACEKIYRSLGEDAEIQTRFTLAENASLDWLAQPTILFHGGRLKRDTYIDMANSARFLGVEAVIFGRTAMGEAVRDGALTDHWQIRRNGTLIHAERFLLSGDIQSELARPAILSGHNAMATLRYVAEDAQTRLEPMREILTGATIPAAASAWNGLLLTRLAAPSGYALTRELIRILTLFRAAPLPRNWTL